MGKYLLAGLYSVSLLLLLCISGCQVAGGRGGGGITHYSPLSSVDCGKPWVISVGYSLAMVDRKEKPSKLIERFKAGVVHIHYSSDNNFIDVPMVFESVNPETGKLKMKADMKPIPCDSNIEYVGYLIDFMFDNHYKKSKYHIVPVTKN
ncbi:MAG: hypothetical protein ABSF37_10560 [Sedimentisphaerales bacterium]